MKKLIALLLCSASFAVGCAFHHGEVIVSKFETTEFISVDIPRVTYKHSHHSKKGAHLQ